MDSPNGYKWATWILLIVVIVLGIMYTKKSNETVSGTFGDLTQALADCRTDISAWKQEYPAGGTTTPEKAQEADAELQDIFDKCMNAVQDAQGTIGTQGTGGAAGSY